MISDKYVPDVVEGADGHLFLTSSVHNILATMRGLIKIDESSKVNFFRNISERRNYCEERGIKYRHFIYPDKLSVLKDLSPFAKEPLATFTSLYRDFISESVVDLHDVLAKDGTNYFFKTDTHLSFEGKLVTSKVILKEFFTDDELGAVDQRFSEMKGNSRAMLGDLGSKLDPKIEEARYDIKSSHTIRFSNQVGANDGLAVVIFNKDWLKCFPKLKGKRLIIFGDSFMERTLPFLSTMYQETLFCRSRYFHTEIVDMFRPDHIITESAERYFSSVRSDCMCPRFHLVYGLKGNRFSDDKEFYGAFNAVLNYGRPPYYQFLNRLKNKYI